VNFVLSAIAPKQLLQQLQQIQFERTNCAYQQRYQKPTWVPMTEPIEVPYIKEYPIAQNATTDTKIH
jgi:hypothetical protein